MTTGAGSRTVASPGVTAARRQGGVFADRSDAGRRLARLVDERLSDESRRDAVVLGLARGGVPVAYEVARHLDAPLDVLVVRKLGVPWAPEIAMGAVAEGDVVVLDDRVVAAAAVDPEQVTAARERARAELVRGVRRYREARSAEPVDGRSVVVVDDGLATGATALAACRAVARRGAASITLAVPVAPLEAVEQVRGCVDSFVALRTPRRFPSVGHWYADFAQVRDDDIVRLLRSAASGRTRAAPGGGVCRAPAESVDRDVDVRAGDVTLHGHLVSRAGARGLAVVARATAGERDVSAARFLLTHLRAADVATLELDLLTFAERPWEENLQDVALLAGRLRAAVASVRGDHPWVGLVGSRATAAAVLRVAGDGGVAAVVLLGHDPRAGGAPAPPGDGTLPPVLSLVGLADDAHADETADAMSHVADWLVHSAGAPRSP